VILLIDNYDSFVHNLARYVRELGCETLVRRNDAVSLSEVRMLAPEAIVLSPGPCTPRESGVSLDLIRALQGTVPLLGVCLGHQALAAGLGGQVVRAPEPVHGRTSWVWHDGQDLFRALPQPLRAARYHSLVVTDEGLPADLKVTARTAEGLIMGLAHRQWPWYGVQFHPESILTDCGHQLLANFLWLAGIVREDAARADHDLASEAATEQAAADGGQERLWRGEGPGGAGENCGQGGPELDTLAGTFPADGAASAGSGGAAASLEDDFYHRRIDGGLPLPQVRE
jgi:anthranilate synthase/aminodeoxychorismate synthase-like glutamine amidotransferase